MQCSVSIHHQVYRILMQSGIFDLATEMGQHRTRRSLADDLGGSTEQMSKKFKQRLGDLVNGQLKKTMSSKTAGQTASKLTSRLLLEHPQYLTDPEVMTVAEVLLGLKSPDQLDPIIIADVLKVSFAGVVRSLFLMQRFRACESF